MKDPNVKPGGKRKQTLFEPEEEKESEATDSYNEGWLSLTAFNGRAKDCFEDFMKIKGHKFHLETEWSSLSWKYPFICHEKALCKVCQVNRASHSGVSAGLGSCEASRSTKTAKASRQGSVV